MGDMGDMYRAWDQAKKDRKQERLEKADDAGWLKHSSTHWYKYLGKQKVNYWPSTGTVMLGNRKTTLNSKRMKAAEAKALKESEL